MQFGVLDRYDRYNMKLLKSEILTDQAVKNFENLRWRRPPSLKIKNSYILATVRPIVTKFGMQMQSYPLERPEC